MFRIVISDKTKASRLISCVAYKTWNTAFCTLVYNIFRSKPAVKNLALKSNSVPLIDPHTTLKEKHIGFKQRHMGCDKLRNLDI